MGISAKMVMDLRAKTGVGMMDCKKALVKTDGDIDAAIKYLREKGMSKAAKKAERDTKEGLIYSYIHSNGKIGTIIEINCETDFVARNEAFIALCKDIAMHITATNPLSIRVEDIDPKLVENEREIYKNKALNDGKPEKIVEKIVDGQIKKFLAQNCLMEQEFVKDPDKTIATLINENIAKLGENIQISRFKRFALGE